MLLFAIGTTAFSAGYDPPGIDQTDQIEVCFATDCDQINALETEQIVFSNHYANLQQAVSVNESRSALKNWQEERKTFTIIEKMTGELNSRCLRC